MDTQKQRVQNGTRQTLLSEGVNEVDATFEHLTVLRVLIEGLAGNEAAGLWLKNVRGIPVVPRMSPFDLVYLDEDQRVVAGLELLPADELPPFRAPAVSALVLPFQTVRASATAAGDRLWIGEGARTETAREPVAEPAQPVVEPEVKPEPALAMKTAATQLAAEPPSEATETPRPVTRTRKKGKAARARATKQQQPAVPRIEENVHRHTPFIVDQPAVPAVSQPAELSGIPAVARPAEPPKPPVALTLPVTAGRIQEVKPRRMEPVRMRPPAKGSVAPKKSANSAAKKARSAMSVDREKLIAGAKSVHEHVERLLKWLSPNTYNEERRASIRRPAQGLIAYGVQNGAVRKFEVGDISSTGISLRTEERLTPGDTVQLMLQHSGPLEERRDRRMDVRAGMVRLTGDGMGMAFNFPEGVHLDLWESAVRGKTYETGPEYIVNEMRMGRALGTIRRICPAMADKTKRMLQKEFSNVRVAGSVRMIYVAEELLDREASTEPRLAPAELVERVLETGSWADVDWIQDMWGGMLAASCSALGDDLSNAPFIDMMSRLTPVHMRILSVTSERAGRPDPVTGPFSVNCCTAGELTKALDLSNLTKMLRSMQDLSDMGLLVAAKRALSAPNDESAKTAITPLGQDLVARWSGKRTSFARGTEAAAEPVEARPETRLGVSYSANAR